MPLDPSDRQFLLAVLSQPLSVARLSQDAATVSNWDALVDYACQHEIVPQLHQALMAVGEVAPAVTREQVRNLFAHVALHNLQLKSELERLTGLLLDAKISVIPWKGPTLAGELYGDIALRSFVDLDLLVPPDQAWLALQVLAVAGYHPDFPLSENRWPALRRAVNHLTLHDRDHGHMVELHWAPFHPMQAFPVDLAPHWQRLNAGGRARVGTLPAEELLVLLCIHGTVHRWEKLKWVVDIERLRHRYPTLEWAEVASLAERGGAGRCVRLGLLLAQGLCAMSSPNAPGLSPAADPVAGRLAVQLRNRLLTSPPRQISGLDACQFDLRCRERWRDRFRQVLSLLFAPRQADWQLFAPGSYCYPLFYLERPLRMVWKWAFKRSHRRFPDVAN